MDATDAVIRIEGLTTHYGTRRILSNINLQIRPRETLVLLGASGTGKSTLLRHILALERPSEGHVFINGIDTCRASEEELNRVRRRMGVLFQSGALFGSMTLADNVALPLRELTKLEESTIQPGFPFCLPLMARLYTRSPPIAQKLRSSHNRSASKAFI